MNIQLKNIVKSFDGKAVIKQTSLIVESGRFITLLGPSGCGKTTLLRMISGLETPDEGEIWFDDRCVFSSEKRIDVPPEKRGLGFVFQDFALWPHMTVFENVAYGLRARKDTADLKTRVMDALSAVQLEQCAERYPHQLSGGQQQRVAFARAIVIQPSCILFDEPLSALDAVLRDEMRGEITRLVDELGITAVFVTHDQTEAMSMSDKIIVLKDGVIEQAGAPEEIYCQPATPFVAKFIGRSNWMGDHAMFRPEAVSMQEPAEKAVKFKTRVESVQFLGNVYELSVHHNDYQWTIASTQKIEPEHEVDIYVKTAEILEFNKEENDELWIAN